MKDSAHWTRRRDRTRGREGGREGGHAPGLDVIVLEVGALVEEIDGPKVLIGGDPRVRDGGHRAWREGGREGGRGQGRSGMSLKVRVSCQNDEIGVSERKGSRKRVCIRGEERRREGGREGGRAYPIPTGPRPGDGCVQRVWPRKVLIRTSGSLQRGTKRRGSSWTQGGREGGREGGRGIGMLRLND